MEKKVHTIWSMGTIKMASNNANPSLSLAIYKSQERSLCGTQLFMYTIANDLQ